MVMRSFSRSLSVVLVGTVLFPGMIRAQTGAPTREEIQRGEFDPPEPRTRTRLSVEGDIERAPCPLADPRFADIRVTISEVQFNNLTAVPSETLRPAWARFAGQSVPIATVCEIRDQAATILRRSGYLAAVQVPAQRIEADGVVRFDVLMAKLVGIQVRGDAGRSEKMIAGYLEAIKDQPVFNINEAERYLLLARDLPGYDVRLTLRPAGTAPGEVIGEVAVLYTPVELDANFQNYGSRDVGRFGGLIRAQFNGLTGMGDMTTVSAFSTSDFDEQKVLQIGHSFRAGRNGLRFSGNLTYAWTRPAVGIDLRSETLVANFNAAYPLIRSQTTNLFGAIGLDFVNQETRIPNLATLSRDKLRTLFARLDYDAIDPRSMSSAQGYSPAEPRWRTGGSIELRHGLSIFDASRSCGVGLVNCLSPNTSIARIEADTTAFVVRASGYAEFRPVPKIAFSLSPRAQWAPNPLLSYEEFSGGNYTVGRGYDPGTIIGDSGLGAQAELRYGSLIPHGATALAVQPFVFFDAAKVWNERSPVIVPRERLFSAGGGVRAAWGNHARLDAALAVPLRRAGFQTERPDPRLLVSLTVKFVPWN